MVSQEPLVAEKAPVELAIESVMVEGGRLLVRYRVVSRHARPLYVFNSPIDWFGLGPGQKLGQRDKNKGPDSGVAYVDVDPDEQRFTLWSERKVPGAPKAGAPIPRFPWAQRIGPGEQKGYVINLPVPLPAWGPHKLPDPEGMDDCVVESGKLALECVLEENALEPKPHAVSEHLFWVRGTPSTTIEAELELPKPFTALYWPE